MKASEIVVGGIYLAKVGTTVTPVRLDAIRELAILYATTRYDVTNLRTGRKTSFRSAAKFRSKVLPQELRALTGLTSQQLWQKYRIDVSVAEQPQSQPEQPQASQTSWLPRGMARIINPPEVEQCSDPTPSPTSRGIAPDSSPWPALSAGASTPAPIDPGSYEWAAAVFDAGYDSDNPPPDGWKPGDPARKYVPQKKDGEQSARPFARSGSSRQVSLPGNAAALSAGRYARQEDSTLSLGLDSILLQEQSAKRGAVVAGYTPTDEQNLILDAAEDAQKRRLNCLVISAGAGAGKTSTLKMLEEVLTGLGQYTAFNTSLVAESKSKFKKARCNTTHSLAFGITGRRYKKRLDGPKMKSEEVALILGLSDICVPTPWVELQPQKTLKGKFLAGQALVAVRKFCSSADREMGEQHFKYIDGIDQPNGKARGHENNKRVHQYLLPFARKVWEDAQDTDGHLPYSHDYYVKIWQLGEGSQAPYIPADYILLDEAQDTAPVLLNILQQQKHALLIFVGDSNQQIYDWRGAVDAMKAFPDAPRCLLTQSFRFGQLIADVANSILATLDEPTDMKMRGLPSIPSRVERVVNPRCVLCRTNGRAVATVLQEFAAGKKPHLIGGGAETISFVKAAKELKSSRSTSHPELCCFSSWHEVEEHAKTDEGSDLRVMVKVIKDYGCDAILAALEKMPEEKYADVVVSTAHKSKGREWDTVKLAEDFPPARAMTDSDRRLLYVAATRAKFKLDITVCPPFLPYLDYETGEESPGINVVFTVPVPEAALTQLQSALLELDLALTDGHDAEHNAKQRVVTAADLLGSDCLYYLADGGYSCVLFSWDGPYHIILTESSTDEAKGRWEAAAELRAAVEAAFIAEMKAPEEKKQEAASPTPPPAEERRGPVPNNLFTWCNHNSAWVIRGPAEHEYMMVEVTRRNGTSSRERLSKAVQKNDDYWLYKKQ